MNTGAWYTLYITYKHTYYMHTQTYFTMATLTEAAVHHRQCVSHPVHLTTTVHSQTTEAERGAREERREGEGGRREREGGRREEGGEGGRHGGEGGGEAGEKDGGGKSMLE